MITQLNPHHKPTPGRFTALLVILVLTGWALGGCGGQDAPPETTTACTVEIRTGGWRAFTELGERILAGEAFTPEDLQLYAEEQDVERWRQTQDSSLSSPTRIGNWLGEAFKAELDLPPAKKLSIDRRSMGQSYRYSFDHRAEIDSVLAIMMEPEWGCRLSETVAFWVPESKAPDSMRVYLLPTSPEVRIQQSDLFLDTGMALAAGPDQDFRHLASLVYKTHGAMDGPHPLRVEGEDSIAQTLRLLMNEAVTTWIEQTPDIRFRSDHFGLGETEVIPEHLHFRARQLVERMEENLPAMFADPAIMARKGTSLTKALIGAGGAARSAAYGMASVIVHHLGEEKLRSVRSSVPGFLAAFQQAALMNPDPLPDPEAMGVDLDLTVPAFSPELFEQLIDLAERHFPSNGS